MALSPNEVQAKLAVQGFEAGMVVKLPGSGDNPDRLFVLMPQSQGWWTLMAPEAMTGKNTDETDWEIAPNGQLLADCFETPFWAYHLVRTNENVIAKMAAHAATHAAPAPRAGISDLTQFRSRKAENGEAR